MRAQLAQQNVTGAQQSLAEWRRVVPRDTPKRLELTGDAAMLENNPPAAVDAWKKALAQNPKNLRVLEKLARGQDTLRQWKEEDATLTNLLALQEKAATYASRARCRRQQHRWAEALADMKHAQQLAPNDSQIEEYARMFEQIENSLASIRELDARIALTPTDDQLLADRALLFLRSGDPELALRDAAAAARIAPWAVRPRLFQAVALQDLGRGDEVEKLGATRPVRLAAFTSEFLEMSARLDSEISVERENAELQVSRAWQLNDVGQPNLALEDARAALAKNPNLADAFAESGYALAKLGRDEEAYAQIKRATELDPNLGAAWDYRGELEIARGDYPAAIQSLTRAFALAPRRATLQKREECYMKTGEFQQAEEDHRALESLPER